MEKRQTRILTFTKFQKLTRICNGSKLRPDSFRLLAVAPAFHMTRCVIQGKIGNENRRQKRVSEEEGEASDQTSSAALPRPVKKHKLKGQTLVSQLKWSEWKKSKSLPRLLTVVEKP
ncbi:hypothetical protein K1719_043814 [Acacia pycnantha]|nr:hypothetical protein K1719_043814 [Acacia pycnantha]